MRKGKNMNAVIIIGKESFDVRRQGTFIQMKEKRRG